MPLRKVPSPLPRVLYSPAFQLLMGPPRIIRDYNLYPPNKHPPLPRHSSTMQCLASAPEKSDFEVRWTVHPYYSCLVHLLAISKNSGSWELSFLGKPGESSHNSIIYSLIRSSSKADSNRFKSLINMEKEESLGQKMQESNQEFRKQFDPNDPNYHGGPTTAVPTGGARIPENMPGMYPQGFDPNQPPVEVDYGEEYRQVESNRQVYLNLKKELAKLGPIVESFLRHQQIFKEKGDPTNEKHKKTYEQNIQKEQASLKGVQQTLSTFVPILEAFDAESQQVAKELSQVVFESGKKYDSKETLGAFNFKSKKLSTKIFSMAQKYLQKLKDIKKEHAKLQKEKKAKEEAEKKQGAEVQPEKKEEGQ